LYFSDEEGMYEVMRTISLGHDGTLPDDVFSPTSSTGSPTQMAKHLLSTGHNSDEEASNSNYMFMSPATLNQSKNRHISAQVYSDALPTPLTVAVVPKPNDLKKKKEVVVKPT